MTSKRPRRRIVQTAVVTMLVAGCGGEPSELATEDAPPEAATQEDAADPGDEEPDGEDPPEDPSEPDHAEVASEDEEPVTEESGEAPSDADVAEAPSEGAGPDADDPAVEKVVELPHVLHYGGMALLTGTLRADPDMDGGCFWLEDHRGVDRGLAALAPQRDGELIEGHNVWARFYDDGSPAELIADGTVLAREGDEVELGGGSWKIDRLEVDDLRCQLDDEVALVNLHRVTVVQGQQGEMGG